MLRLWSTDTWEQLAAMPLNASRMLPMQISPDGRLAAIGAEYKILLVDLEKQAVVEDFALPIKGVYALSFSPDGKRLACGSADKKVRVWELD